MEAVRKRITCRLERIVMLRRIRLHREILADSAGGAGLHAGWFPALEYIIRHDGCAQKELAGAVSRHARIGGADDKADAAVRADRQEL